MRSVSSYGENDECPARTVWTTPFHAPSTALTASVLRRFPRPLLRPLNAANFVFFAMRSLDEKKGKDYHRTAMKQTFTVIIESESANNAEVPMKEVLAQDVTGVQTAVRGTRFGRELPAF